MKNEKNILYGIIGLLVGIVLTVYITSNAVNNNMTGIMGMMGINSPSNRSGMMSNVDKHFIEEMIPHHEGAIEMAQLAKVRSSKQEVKTLAVDIIKSQSSEIEQMKKWYKDWYGQNVPENEDMDTGMGRGIMHGGMMEDATDTEALKNSENFDKEFIEEMIPHHQMAVVMANMLEQGTTRAEMKKLSKNIRLAQTKEINEMRQWYKNWGY